MPWLIQTKRKNFKRKTEHINEYQCVFDSKYFNAKYLIQMLYSRVPLNSNNAKLKHKSKVKLTKLIWVFFINFSYEIEHSDLKDLLLDMMTSSNGNIFRVTGHLCGESPPQRPVTRSFDVFFDLRLNKRLSKQWWCWWFETLSCPLWRHCNG